MFGIINLPTFILAGILLNLTPGADTMYIVGRSIAQGKKAGIYSALGISTGILFHTTFAAFGLSLIVARSAMAFNIIKYAGAMYLVYLGIKMIITKAPVKFDAEKKDINSRKLYASGILTNVLNPKVALYFLVFLPQFVKTSAAHNPLPFIILGIIFVIPGTAWCIIIALSAARVSGRINQNNKIAMWLNRVTGGVFITLGLRLAWMSRK
jgi:threonine/homoserine/homoserine lactone efflux protein